MSGFEFTTLCIQDEFGGIEGVEGGCCGCCCCSEKSEKAKCGGSRMLYEQTDVDVTVINHFCLERSVCVISCQGSDFSPSHRADVSWKEE